jgi:hypothetical protein
MTPDPTQPSDAELLAWIIASIAVEKGDIKGHTFHGNQWTGGIAFGEITPELSQTAMNLRKEWEKFIDGPEVLKANITNDLWDALKSQYGDKLTAMGREKAANQNDGWGNIITEYGDNEMLGKEAVSDLVRAWAGTSNDNNSQSLAVQQAVKDEFGLEGTSEWNGALPETEAEVEKDYKENGELYRAFVRAQYEGTQKYFADRGITSLPIYRGFMVNTDYPFPDWVSKILSGSHTSDSEIPLRPLSSWSLSNTTAVQFTRSSGFIFAGSIPVSRVLSTPYTGVGCLKEYEVTLLGGSTKGIQISR